MITIQADTVPELRAIIDELSTQTVTVGQVTVATPAPQVAEPLTPPVVEPPTQPTEPLTDASGVVWSAEHHASTQTKKKDGDWKAKKGGDKTALAAYEGQFVVDPAPVAPPVVDPAPVAPPVVDPAPVQQPTNFNDIMVKITELTAAGKIDPVGIQTLCQNSGLVNITELAGKPEFIPTVYASLCAIQ